MSEDSLQCASATIASSTNPCTSTSTSSPSPGGTIISSSPPPLSAELAVVAADFPWLPAEGLKFKCTACGKCCTKLDGPVWVTKNDVTVMAHHLKLFEGSFMNKYVTLRRFKPRDSLGTAQVRRMVLKNRDQSTDCAFLVRHNKGKTSCSIYNARPVQCRTYPWWRDNLTDADAWEREKEHCEGVEHVDADLVSS